MQHRMYARSRFAFVQVYTGTVLGGRRSGRHRSDPCLLSSAALRLQFLRVRIIPLRDTIDRSSKMPGLDLQSTLFVTNLTVLFPAGGHGL